MLGGSRRLLLPLEPGCLRDLRDWARVWMAAQPTVGVDPDAVVLSMTELVTNSSRHGSGPIDVQLRWDSHLLHLGVSDCSDDLPRQSLVAPETGGRGIVVVEASSTRWGVRPDSAGGKTVWCEFAASGPRQRKGGGPRPSNSHGPVWA
jgi:hypothetical protein